VERHLNRSRQGDLGEASAMTWLMSQGATVFLPFGHSPQIDLIAQFGAHLVRLQVKTTVCRVQTPAGHARWSALIATRGGNRSWSGRAKVIDREAVDAVYVLVGDGRRWLIPVDELGARSSIQLGGPKYSEYELEPEAALEDLVYGTNAANPRIRAALGGVSKRSKDGGCKPSGSAFAGSNPASPTSTDDPLQRTPAGQTRVSANRQIVIPKAAFAAAGLAPGDRLKATPIPDGVLFRRVGSPTREGPP
jgi:hypothetical protein